MLACQFLHTHTRFENVFSSKSARTELNLNHSSLCLGRGKQEPFEGISYIMLLRFHVWLSTELQTELAFQSGAIRSIVWR